MQQNEAELRALVSKATNLHKEYYTVQWAAAQDDAEAINAVPARRNVEDDELVSMSKEQLRQKMRCEEDKVEREMKRQQVAMATRARNGEAAAELEGLVNVAIKVMLSGWEG
ncbi:TGACG-sequence-specific DNA-binding protein TGA-1A [Pyrus ussuriensis x Pyrus communis]|uniref:TGACG-sequence-specific DNA-binding protein TGA-1A n=1 Tax=Pyrus ussuriensis x Pyrus communis TaxID=2448454 RepID=A0A5N5HJ01_9ROSA|nr:TGACG-sequence-specific DNA-binding protein TGA-1A [Pyrus ussuriensis x Pyrus communis]